MLDIIPKQRLEGSGKLSKIGRLGKDVRTLKKGPSCGKFPTFVAFCRLKMWYSTGHLKSNRKHCFSSLRSQRQPEPLESEGEMMEKKILEKAQIQLNSDESPLNS